MFVRKISYLTWKENGLADFGEIWQAGPPYVIPVRFQNLSPDLFLLVPIDFFAAATGSGLRVGLKSDDTYLKIAYARLRMSGNISPHYNMSPVVKT